MSKSKFFIVDDTYKRHTHSNEHTDLKCRGRGYDELIKIRIIGDCGVGKSNLLLRYVEDTYSVSWVTTRNIDFREKYV